MAFKFTDAGRYPYEPGGFFLGYGKDGEEVGIRSDRHLITVAGARSGKGAALIVPNLKRWPGACVVVDPKGENATITAGERAAMGQHVGVVDPYRIAKGDAAGLRCSINPLALLDPDALTIRADLEALGDGLIRRFDAKHAQWDNAAAAICAGVADFVLTVAPPEERTLLSVRSLLLLPDETTETDEDGEVVKDKDGKPVRVSPLKNVAEAMARTSTAAGLAKQAGVLILSKFSNPEGVPASAFNRAIEETGWIDDPAFASILGGGDLPAFDLSTLKAGTGSLYLCIPPRLLMVRGGFLRVFVSMGLHVMAGELADHDGGGRCLFLLDEFHSLGKVELIAKAAGLMPGYGVHLWPFLQDLGQLTALYGDDEMGTFFGNADAHIFFGNTDGRTLDHVSQRISAERKESLPPNHVKELVAKHDDDKTARSMIVFAKGDDILQVALAPYFINCFIPPPFGDWHEAKFKKEDTKQNVEDAKELIIARCSVWIVAACLAVMAFATFGIWGGIYTLAALFALTIFADEVVAGRVKRRQIDRSAAQTKARIKQFLRG